MEGVEFLFHNKITFTTFYFCFLIFHFVSRFFLWYFFTYFFRQKIFFKVSTSSSNPRLHPPPQTRPLPTRSATDLLGTKPSPCQDSCRSRLLSTSGTRAHQQCPLRKEKQTSEATFL